MRELEANVEVLMLSELTADLMPNQKHDFYERWGISAEEAHAMGADLSEHLEFDDGDVESARGLNEHDDFELDKMGLHNAKNHLRIVGDLIKLDPLLMKNEQHLTQEERRLSNAYSRSLEKRRQGISDRLSYFEILRNRDLF